MTNRLELAVRLQYSFKTNTETLSKLLTLNVKRNNNPHSVNIVAINAIKHKKHLLVDIIVGTDDPNNPARGGAGDPLNPDPQRSNELQNQQFIKNLEELKINYKKNPVIQIFNDEAITGTPGAYRIGLTALNCAHIGVRSSCFGEPALLFPLVTYEASDGSTGFKSHADSVFFRVSPKKTDKAVFVLKSLDLSFPFNEEQLCINRDNIENLV